MFNFKEIHFDIGFSLSAREWMPDSISSNPQQYLLVHGLASNARTWDKVGRHLASQGGHVVAIDQRNHGESEATEDGFDFEQITADLCAILDQLNWAKPILVGQSWGGNVLTEFGVRYPGRAQALIMVDGGFLDLKLWGEDWDAVYEKLLPPDVSQFSADMMRSMIQFGHPEWDDEGVEMTMRNLRILPNGMMERRLPIEKHMRILRAIYDQNMAKLYRKIEEPVLILAAGPKAEPDEIKKQSLENAKQIKNVTIEWFAETDHDIHVHKPLELCERIEHWLEQAIRGDG